MQYQTDNGPIRVTTTTAAQLETTLRGKIRSGVGFALATLNLDHIVKMNTDAEFYKAYAAQDIVVADGRPIVWTSQLAGTPIELLPGSDMVVPIAGWARDEGAPIALLGSTEGSLEKAAHYLQSVVPGLEIAAKISPKFGFDPTSDAAKSYLIDIERSGAKICLLALGAPKQEVLAFYGREVAPTVGFISIGAGLDFLAGTQRRAPKWMRAIALEWLWRLAGNPKRMAARYWACVIVLPRLVFQALLYRRDQKDVA